MYGQPPPAFFSGPPPAPAAQAPVPDSKPAKKKKEKPREKLPIPGAEGWLRVTTTEDNVFYTHVERKESHWTVPEEIADAVRELERAEREEREKVAKEEKQAREKELEERRAKEEAEREELRRIREDIQREEQAKKEAEAAAQALKRKREGEEDGREGAPGGGSASPSPEEKRARVGSSEAAAAPDQDEGDDEDEEWQRAMAAEMAAEAADSSAQQPAPPGPPPAFPSAPAGAAPAFSPPPASTNVELSVDEAKALFLHMLSSLNNTPSEVNPMAPWDRELPKFVHHPNYTLLRTLRDRQDAFNEWCKLRLRQKRTAGPGAKNDHGRKASPANTPVAEVAAKAGERASSNEAGPSSGDASVAYRALLEAEVASTRTRWEDFRKAWKKDRRFFGFGRDEKEREKAFRAWLRELGEREWSISAWHEKQPKLTHARIRISGKRQAALAAESAFLSLLSEKLSSSTRDAARSAARTGGDDALNAAWREAKRAPGLDSDARYEAVGSSTRRAELFGAWARGEEGRSNTNGSASASKDPKREEQRSKGNERQEKERDAQRALKEREEQVRKQRARVEGQNRAAFGAATHEER